MRSISRASTLISLWITVLISFFAITSAAYAASTSACNTSGSETTTGTAATGVCCDNGQTAKTVADCMQTCPGANGQAGKTIPQDQDCATTGGNCSVSLSQCDLIVKYINPFIVFMSALVSVAVVASIIIGGIQYSSSAGDPGKAAAAKDRIRNAIIALIVFIALDAMLNFLLPGGIL